MEHHPAVTSWRHGPAVVRPHSAASWDSLPLGQLLLCHRCGRHDPAMRSGDRCDGVEERWSSGRVCRTQRGERCAPYHDLVDDGVESGEAVLARAEDAVVLELGDE